MTYKLLGTECPIPNRCQSKIPDLKGVSMPLTDSEARYRRTNALSKIKSTSTNVLDESLPLGTAVNPRERPRGMIAPSTSLINFSQTPHQAPTLSVQPPPSSSSANPSRSGSAAQLMFDDDFSKIPSHAISLTSIPTVASSTTNEQNISRVRPSPPATVSTASGFSFQQQLLPFPPPPSSATSSNLHAHRRSSSQTFSPTNIQSSFQIASSADLSHSKEASTDDNDAEEITTNFSKFKALNISDLHTDDDQVFLADNQVSLSFCALHRYSIVICFCL